MTNEKDIIELVTYTDTFDSNSGECLGFTGLEIDVSKYTWEIHHERRDILSHALVFLLTELSEFLPTEYPISEFVNDQILPRVPFSPTAVTRRA